MTDLLSQPVVVPGISLLLYIILVYVTFPINHSNQHIRTTQPLSVIYNLFINQSNCNRYHPSPTGRPIKLTMIKVQSDAQN